MDSILFFLLVKHHEHNLLMNQAIFIDHGASDDFDYCEAILYTMTCLYNQHYHIFTINILNH